MMKIQPPQIEIGDTSKIDWYASPWSGVSYKWMRIGPGGADVIDMLRVEKGAILSPHQHTTNQTSFLVSGYVRAGDGTEMGAGSWIHIPAGLRHGHVALEEAIWVDFFPGLLFWFMDDGAVYNLRADGQIAALGRVKPVDGSLT